MQLTQKIRIFPTEEQKKVLYEMSERCRLLYNFALKKRIDAWKNENKFIGYIIDNTKAKTTIIGELSVKKICKINKYQKRLHQSIHNTGHISRFVRFLTYKAKLEGKKIIEINEMKTTKKCCACNKEHKMPLYKRIMECDCGNRIDRDKNSAVNIMFRYLLQNAKWTSYQQFVDNLRKTGIPIQVLYSQEASYIDGSSSPF